MPWHACLGPGPFCNMWMEAGAGTSAGRLICTGKFHCVVVREFWR